MEQMMNGHPYIRPQRNNPERRRHFRRELFYACCAAAGLILAAWFTVAPKLGASHRLRGFGSGALPVDCGPRVCGGAVVGPSCRDYSDMSTFGGMGVIGIDRDSRGGREADETEEALKLSQGIYP